MLSVVVDRYEQALRNLGANDEPSAQQLLSTMEFTPPMSWSERRQLIARFTRAAQKRK